jgi:hypothetical protein
LVRLWDLAGRSPNTACSLHGGLETARGIDSKYGLAVADEEIVLMGPATPSGRCRQDLLGDDL